MSYVQAGYVVALGGVALYAAGLVLRRRRWERAARHTQSRELAAGASEHGTAS
jgi:hypothetical protein